MTITLPPTPALERAIARRRPPSPVSPAAVNPTDPGPPKTGIPFWCAFAAGFEGPLYDPDAWGSVRLGGHWLPGTCTVDGSAVHKIDVQKASGADGGALIERGYVPGEFDIDMKIWTPEHWETWRLIRPQIFRRPNKLDIHDAKKGGASKAQQSVTIRSVLPVQHPALADADIDACLIKSISLPRVGPERDSRIISIKCVQYVAPAKKSEANTTRKGSGQADVTISAGQDWHAKADNAVQKPSEANAGEPGGDEADVGDL